MVDNTFTIEVLCEVLSYRVIETLVVESEDTESLLIQPGHDLKTLVTCTPRGINNHRILVTVERMILAPQTAIDAAGDAPEVPGFPWWMFHAGGVILGAGAYVWVSGGPSRTLRLQIAHARRRPWTGNRTAPVTE